MKKGYSPRKNINYQNGTPRWRGLGLNPDKLGKIDNHKQEMWEAPLPQFIEEIYFKRFKREEPIKVYSLRELIAAAKPESKRRKGKKVSTRKMLL